MELSRTSTFAPPDARKLSSGADSLKANLRTPEHTVKAGQGEEPNGSAQKRLEPAGDLEGIPCGVLGASIVHWTCQGGGRQMTRCCSGIFPVYLRYISGLPPLFRPCNPAGTSGALRPDHGALGLL